MTIFGGNISPGMDQNSPNINYFHVAIVAPWLYFLSTQPTNWDTYLKLTALGVGAWHAYRAYCKVSHPEQKQDLHKPENTVLSMAF